MLLLHAKSYPVRFVVEIFLALVGPYPALFLIVAERKSVDLTRTDRAVAVAVIFAAHPVLKGSNAWNTYNVLSGNSKLEGTKMSSKKPSDTIQA